MSLALLAMSVARQTCTPQQREAIDYAEGLFTVLGDLVGVTFAKVALSGGDKDALNALADELKAVSDRHSALAGKRLVPAPAKPPTDVLITNPHHTGCGSPFCDKCGAGLKAGGAS